MFKQTINLLPSEFRKVYIPFDSIKLFKTVGFSLLFVVLISVVLAYLNYSVKNKLVLAEQQNKQSKIALDEFQANNAKISLDDTIVIRIEKYEEMLRQRQAFLKRLNGENFGNTNGFSEYLLALGRQKFNNIWIETLQIEGEASAFGIKGKAVTPTDITLFLTKLQQEPAMDGIVFENLKIKRQPTEKGDFVGFEISYGSFTGFDDANSRPALNAALAKANLPSINMK